MPKSFQILPFLAVVAIGAVLAASSGDGTVGFGRVRDVASGSADDSRRAAEPLSDKLDTVYRTIGVRPDQEVAWRHFAEAMMELERLTRAYEQRVASGKTIDKTAERARHAMIYAAGMNEIDSKFSLGQVVVIRKLASRAARSALCRSLTAD